jgi:nitric oxide dioxygenase
MYYKYIFIEIVELLKPKEINRMLNDAQTAIIQATVPVLQIHGEAITRTFYSNLFHAHPELYNIFNPANQHNGGQQRSLAAAVLAYAQHIQNPSVLGHMLNRIESKHVSLEVRPEHYPIVGQFLLGAISEVLGEAATPEIIDAWGAAYGQLADLMTGHEKARYVKDVEQQFGWSGFKVFHVAKKVAESSVMTSFYLEPKGASGIPSFTPGQYISVRVQPKGHPYQQIRQYSLSSAPHERHYRISVQREVAPASDVAAPNGLVSNYLHDHVAEGDLIDVHVPSGDFVLSEGGSPVVLLSGGSGITALLSMLEHLASPAGGSREVLFIHAARDRSRHSFTQHLRDLAKKRAGISVKVLYEEVSSADVAGEHHDVEGRITGQFLKSHLPAGEPEFYYCGPIGFMGAMEALLDDMGVPAQRRFSETFAPDPSFTIA